MYTLICRLFHKLHKRPVTVICLCLLLTAIAAFYANKIHLKSSLLEVLPNEFHSIQLLKKTEENFGGLGKLTLIFQSPDSNFNKRTLQQTANALSTHPNINFLDYKNEIQYYSENQLLYINLEDLKTIEERVDSLVVFHQAKNNPLLVDLSSEDSLDSPVEPELDFKDLEQKYNRRLKPYYGSLDETILILHIFPNFDVSNYTQCKSLYRDVNRVIDPLKQDSSLDILMTGEVLETIQNEGRLMREVTESGWVSFFAIFFLIALFYFRMPLGPILALVPLGMGVIWTLALAKIFVGHLNLVSLSLGIILIGLGLDAALHLLARYVEERRKGFGAEVAFETITLETGPAISTSALTSAGAFFSITITQFKGFSEFGIIAGLGIICTMIAILLVFPCILILLEKQRLVYVFGSRMYSLNLFKRRKFSLWKPFGIATFFISIFSLILGVQTRFEYNFEKLDFANSNETADSLLHIAGEAIVTPAVIMTDSPDKAAEVTREIQRQIKTDSLSPTIHSVYSLHSLLPQNQTEKIQIINEIKEKLEPVFSSTPDSLLPAELIRLRNNWNVKPLGLTDLPPSFKKKFIGKNQLEENFVFIFPSVDLSSGINCRAFANDVREITTPEGNVYKSSGMALVYADLLNIMIPDTIKALILSLFIVFALILLNTRSLKATVLVLIPLILGILWTMGLMRIFSIRINYFNLVVLPAMIGIGIDNSVHLFHRYKEEGIGSLYWVLRKTGVIITATSLTSLAGFIGLGFSHHLGLKSMGLTAILGIGSTFLATLLFSPFLLGYLDSKKINQLSENSESPLP